MYKVLACGDRDWTSSAIIRIALWHINKTVEHPVLIHGAAKGADSIAAFEAEKMGWVIKSYPAKWDVHGRAAGPIRNRLMFDTERPNVVYAFHNNLTKSKGTKDMVTYALDNGAYVVLFTEHGIFERGPK